MKSISFSRLGQAFVVLGLISRIGIAAAPPTTINYDSLNRIISLREGSNSYRTFSYDPSGNRTGETVALAFGVAAIPNMQVAVDTPVVFPLATTGSLVNRDARWTVRSSNPSLADKSGIRILGAGTDSPTAEITVIKGAVGKSRISVIASDGNVGSTTSFTLTVGTNRSPLAVSDSAQHPPGLGTKIERNKLLANDSDPDRDPISLASVGQVSAHGGLVRVFGPFVAYEPPEGYDGPDFFSYTISDSHGATANATVFVRGQTVAQTVPITVVGSELLSNGHRLVSFIGLPNAAYEIQVSLDLTTWSVAGVVYSDSRGSYHYEDAEAELYPTRFYRAVFR